MTIDAALVVESCTCTLTDVWNLSTIDAAPTPITMKSVASSDANHNETNQSQWNQSMRSVASSDANHNEICWQSMQLRCQSQWNLSPAPTPITMKPIDHNETNQWDLSPAPTPITMKSVDNQCSSDASFQEPANKNPWLKTLGYFLDMDHRCA
jgi:hypothetical protein